ncbi:MAG: abortive infection family protein [Phycisphaerales bacterium]|nr:abortive infection family protein [Phycisphaerales bacterium]
MADLSNSERQQIEQAFRMSSGYVLDFSNETFREFIQEAVARNICTDDYSRKGSSKAKRLRAFFRAEPNHVVGTLVDALVTHARTLTDPPSSELLDACQRIAVRLKQSAPVLEQVGADTSDATFAALTRCVRQAIDSNQPETGLDRLHTFFVSLVRQVCEKRGVRGTRDEPAHSVLGKYLKYLKGSRHVHSDMTLKILNYAQSTMDAFNRVRNNQSLAHPNPMLNYDESLLIFNHVVAVVNFIRSVEQRVDHAERPAMEAASSENSDIPF